MRVTFFRENWILKNNFSMYKSIFKPAASCTDEIHFPAHLQICCKAEFKNVAQVAFAVHIWLFCQS